MKKKELDIGGWRFNYKTRWGKFILTHKVVQRTSEDVDFKFSVNLLRKSHMLKELKAFRLELQSNFAIPNLIAHFGVYFYRT